MAVEPCLALVFGVAWWIGIREDGVSPSLDRDPAKLQTRSIGTFILMGQIKQLSEKQQAGLFFKIHLTKYLKVANIRHGVGSDVLRTEVKKVQDVSEEL